MLSLDRSVTYQIKVPGHLNERWPEWAEGLKITIESESDGSPITILTGAFDQAALQSLFRRLYTMGLPLISVIWIDYT